MDRKQILQNIQKAREEGVPDALIQQRLIDNGYMPAPTQAPPDTVAPGLDSMMTQTTPDQSMMALTPNQGNDGSTLEKFLRSDALPVIGSTLGAIGGGVLGAGAGGVGAVPGAIAGSAGGGAGGEAVRRTLLRIMGEDPDEGQDDAGGGLATDIKEIAFEGGESALWELVGGKAVKYGGKALKSAGGKVVGKAADVVGLSPKSLARRAIPITTTEFAETYGKLSKNMDVFDVLFKEGILDAGSPDEMLEAVAFKQGQAMQGLDQVLARAGENGQVIKVSSLVDDIEENIMGKLTMPDTNRPIPGTEQARKLLAEFSDELKAYGDTITPAQANEIKKRMYGVVSTFKEGPLNSPDIKRRFASLFRKEIETIAPEAAGLNQTWGALEMSKNAIKKSATPSFSSGGMFASALQALPFAGIGAVTAGPVGGGAAYIGAVIGNQALKDPQTAGKVAQTMYKISQLGSEAPPIAKTFYNLIQPVMSQIGGRAISDAASDSDKDDDVLSQLAQNAKASSKQNDQAAEDLSQRYLFPDPASAGLDDIAGGEYTSPDSMRSANGLPNQHGLGLTKEAAAVAMLAYPKHAALIQNIYELLNEDEKEAMSAAEEKRLMELNTVQGISNVAKQYMSQINTGPISGSATNLQNAVTLGNADIDAANYNEWRGAMVSVLARSISQESGTMTDQDIRRADGLLPKLTDSEEKVRFKLMQLDAIIQDGFDDLGVENRKAPTVNVEQ